MFSNHHSVGDSVIERLFKRMDDFMESMEELFVMLLSFAVVCLFCAFMLISMFKAVF